MQVFAFHVFVARGSTYADVEYADWLRAAGFTTVERVRLPGATG